MRSSPALPTSTCGAKSPVLTPRLRGAGAGSRQRRFRDSPARSGRVRQQDVPMGGGWVGQGSGDARSSHTASWSAAYRAWHPAGPSLAPRCPSPVATPPLPLPPAPGWQLLRAVSSLWVPSALPLCPQLPPREYATPCGKPPGLGRAGAVSSRWTLQPVPAPWGWTQERAALCVQTHFIPFSVPGLISPLLWDKCPHAQNFWGCYKCHFLLGWGRVAASSATCKLGLKAVRPWFWWLVAVLPQRVRCLRLPGVGACQTFTERPRRVNQIL